MDVNTTIYGKYRAISVASPGPLGRLAFTFRQQLVRSIDGRVLNLDTPLNLSTHIRR